MSERPRKLDLTGAPQPGDSQSSVCPTTGRTIPECCCRRCVDDQLRRHAPWLLDRRFGREPPRRAA